MAVITLLDQQVVGINPSKTTSKPLGTAMVHFLPPRCCDCGALPGKEHLSWCPYSGPGVLHESSIEFEPEQTPAESADDGKLRVPTISIDRETLDLEALRPFFTKEGLRGAVQNHLGEFGYQRSISGVVYNYEKPPKEE